MDDSRKSGTDKNSPTSASADSLKQEIERLKRENGILRNILDNIPANVFWKDINNRFLGCNRHTLPVIAVNSTDEIVGKATSDILPKDIADKLEAIDQSIMDEEKKTYVEESGLDQFNHPAVFLTIKSPLYDNKNKLSGLIGISLDITERKKIEEELKIAKEKAEAASRIKSDFIANMNHDLKTPIAGIIGLSELLTKALHNDEKDIAEKLVMSGRQLLAFIENCLELSKIEINNKLSKESHFDLHTLLKEIHDLFRPSLRFKGLPLEVRINKNVPGYLFGNREGLYRILLNLISNAIKFTPKGYIKVSIGMAETLSDNEIMLEVKIKDTGVGIVKENQKQTTFDCFTQLTPSYKGTHEGTGLGLFIVQTYVDKMNGKILLESEINKGTEFTIVLPFKTGEAGHEIKEKNTHQNARNLLNNFTNPSHQVLSIPTTLNGGTHILLVEDNIIAQQIQHSIFTSLNCEIDVANSGEKAIDLFEPGKYDLVIMDIGLPDIQGNEASLQIRQKEKNSPFRAPIIALTAHATDESIKKYLNAGIDAVYNKPLSRIQAEEIIKKIKSN